jgi:hypothetical protein
MRVPVLYTIYILIVLAGLLFNFFNRYIAQA